MTITLERVGKRFHRDWVIRDLSKEFTTPVQYGIAGPNGSGKSTLIRIIAGQLMPSEGHVFFREGNKHIPPDKIYQRLSWAAPYMELIDEFTLTELLLFHSRFRPLTQPHSTIIEAMGLESHSKKSLGEFSSGMKQRVRLALAIYSQSELLLLDEPTSNLDAEGIAWYHKLMSEPGRSRLVMVASNEEHDLEGCSERVSLTHHHKV